MGYKNANKVLPPDLLSRIQEFIDGECLYIPRKECNKKQWGEANNSKEIVSRRNKEIIREYRRGVTVKELAKTYYLSDKTIYQILSTSK